MIGRLLRRRRRLPQPTYRLTVELFVPGLTREETSALTHAIWRAHEAWVAEHMDGRWRLVNTTAAIVDDHVAAYTGRPL